MPRMELEYWWLISSSSTWILATLTFMAMHKVKVEQNASNKDQ
jgi:hypothetical protein